MDSISKVFLAEALDGWATSLANKEECTWDDVSTLLSYGASVVHEDLLPVSSSFVSTDDVTVLATCKFLKLSKGNYQEKIVPFLCSYLQHIGKFCWQSSGIQATRYSSVNNFTHGFCKRLLECSGLKKSSYELVASSISAYLRSVTEHLQSNEPSNLSKMIYYHSLHGFLRAMLDASVEKSDFSLLFMIPSISTLLSHDFQHMVHLQKTSTSEKGVQASYASWPALDENVMRAYLARALVRILLQNGSVSYNEYIDAWCTDKTLPDLTICDPHSFKVLESAYQVIWNVTKNHMARLGQDSLLAKEYLLLSVVCGLSLNTVPPQFLELMKNTFESGKTLNYDLQIALLSALQAFIPKNIGLSQQVLMLLDDIEHRHLWCNRDFTEKEKDYLRSCYSLTYVYALKNLSPNFDFSAALMRHVNILCALPIEKERQLALQISIIEKLLEVSTNEPMSEDLIPLLVGTLNDIHQKAHVAKLLLSTLVDVAIATECQDFVEVLDAMTNTFKQIIVLDSTNKAVKTEIAKQFIRLSDTPDLTDDVREKLLNRVLVMFIELASHGQNGMQIQHDYVLPDDSSNLVIIIGVISQIAADYTKESNIAEKHELVSLFRKMWAYCVVHGVDATGVWRYSWKPIMQKIAELTPRLTSGKSAKLSLSEVKADLGSFSKNEDVVNVNRSIQKLSDPTVQSVNGSIKIFLRSIYHIDCLLLDQKKVPNVYTYLNELFDLDIRDELKKVAHQALDTLNEEVITELVRSLVLQFPTFNLKLYNFVFSHLESLLKEHAYVLRDPMIVRCVFEMLQILSKAADDDYLGRTTYTYRLALDHTAHEIRIPTGYEYRQHIFGEYRKFWKAMYENAAKKSSNEILTLLQNYIMTMRSFDEKVTGHAGFTLAIEIGISKHGCHDFSGILVNALSFHSSQLSNTARFFDLFSQRTFDTGSTKSLNRHFDSIVPSSGHLEGSIKQELKYLSGAAARKLHIDGKKFYETFSRAASILIHSDTLDSDLLHLLCLTPVQHFTESSLMAGVDAWTWLLTSRPDLKIQFMSVQVEVWEWTIRRSRGIFSQKFAVANSFSKKMNYGPSKRPKDLETSFTYFLPHLIWIQFLTSHYDSNRGWSSDFTLQYLRLLQVTIFKRGRNSNHPLARVCYLKLWHLFRRVILDSHITDWNRESYLQERIYELLLGVLAMPTSWNAYDDKYVAGDIEIMLEIFRNVKEDLRQEPWDFEDGASIKDDHKSQSGEQYEYQSKHERIKTIQKISVTVIELELHRLFVWYNPQKDPKFDVFDDTEFRVRKKLSKKFCRVFIKEAWNISPTLAVHLAQKGSLRGSREVLIEIASAHAFFCTPYPDAISYVATEAHIKAEIAALQYSIFWAPVSPITSISFFLPNYEYDPYLIQYGLRSLDSYPTEVVFFYVPQIVQSLRHDTLGYSESFIVSTAKISQLFAHQIVWNMNANMFKDEESTDPDVLKPALDRIVEKIISSLDGSDKDFYEREFTFFDKVTGISGKLKPFIKRSKSEKKQKIDEELALVKVDAGVYLPSNPESIVIDIDYSSGRPLQSHAKAPFMATFKIKRATMYPLEAKDKRQSSYESLYLRDDQNDDIESDISSDDECLWQSAIFKVGDDCRQDVLALQLIAIFNNIYAHIGLDLYLFPYRVVATAPGCGIIEVVPNSVSRDQMGRSNINNLHEWFLATYGAETTLKYQQARDNFVKSLAAYSVILYLLQIKDRHNGNVLIDQDGHVVHIDFGFIFDITPGGVKFELSPFKLTKEMVQILGGTPDALPYRTFVTYCVKAFLAARPYAENIVQMVKLMLDSGLPCFKGEKTIIRLRERFKLELSEKLAAEYMIKLVQESHQAWSTVFYDGYQKLTNGIPF